MGYIYKIIHKDSKRVYIGQTSKTIEERWLKHLEDSKYIQNSHLYNAFRKYGIEAFSIEEVEQVDVDQLDRREMHWISFYEATEANTGFNIAEGGNKPPSRKGTTHSDEAKEKNRQAHLGKKLGTPSEETRRRISEAKKGMVFSEEHKKALSEAWKTRPPVSDETKRKRSKALRGKANIKKYTLISPDGVEYITENGLSQFCREHKLYNVGMSRLVNGHIEEFKGWRIANGTDNNIIT